MRLVLFCLAVALRAAVASAGCDETCSSGVYKGDCGALSKRTNCWHSGPLSVDICCAADKSDCCEGDPGPIAGVVLGLFGGVIMMYFCCVKEEGGWGLTCCKGGICCGPDGCCCPHGGAKGPLMDIAL